MSQLLDHAPTISLLFFFTVFVFVAVRAYRPSAKAALQEHAYIPLKEDSSER